MIQKQTQLKVYDNTGVKNVKCINVYKKKYAKIGDLLLVSIKKVKPKLNKKYKLSKGDICKAILIKSKYNQKNYMNNFINFKDNGVILLNSQKKLLGTRILGPIPIYLRKLKQFKIISLSSIII